MRGEKRWIGLILGKDDNQALLEVLFFQPSLDGSFVMTHYGT